MKMFYGVFSLAILPVAVSLSLSAAFAAPVKSGGPPHFDVNPSCRAAAEASGGHDRLQGCLASENSARDQLVKQWTQFPVASRTLCLQSASAGGEPTYTELITCLEMDRDAKLKPADNTVVPTVNATGMKPAVERAHGH